ncbi:RNA-directed DNA polymerase (Reverse transcriptase), Ribonuclease H [Gossypium australe]|uniref:RNA-directed DNA polymerase (Reverse transcriptase), Ribonuclease H n=1 Tax=Gossypium australe TaxID=47621 RepID=A0A5B6VIM0_9ROSI|nr:RNA-directed DNA polymerase (Reverse transcriptase), Ribonuclease H [Gossypium australe]
MLARTSTGATHFSLVYGMDAVLPIEVEIPSLRILSKLKLDEAEWVKSQTSWSNVPETNDAGLQQKVHPRVFHEGDLILKRSSLCKRTSEESGCLIGKDLMLKRRPFSRGALILAEMDGKS